MRPGTVKLPSVAMRVAALLAALLVAILTVLAASPELHQRLHRQDPLAGTHAAHAGSHADDDDGCAVTLFAQGLVLPLALLVLGFAGRVVRALNPAAADRDVPGAPRFLLLPSQAPPLG